MEVILYGLSEPCDMCVLELGQMSNKRAAIGGIELTTDDLAFGYCFELTNASRASEHADVDGKIVSVCRGTKIVVVRSQSLMEIDVAHEAAQKGLDLLCYRHKVDTRIIGAATDYLKWSRSPDGRLHVQLTSIGHSSISMGVPKIIITRPDGTQVQQTEPADEWQPSLRFFRYARTSDDLVDAYRNTFLALEALLSERTPINKIVHRQNSVPKIVARLIARLNIGGAEGEEAWLKRALSELNAHGFDLSKYSSPGATNHVNSIVKRLYRQSRHPLFHAKKGRPVTLPSPSLSEAATLLGSLQTLTELYLDVMAYTASMRKPSGHLYPAALKGAANILAKARLIYSADDSVLEDGSVISPKGLSTAILGTPQVDENEDPYLHKVRISGKAAGGTIRRLVLADDTDQPMFGIRLEAPLVLPKGTPFEVIAGIRFLNEERVRYRFKT